MTKSQALDLIQRRHPEWREHQVRWRWLQDSLEGGDRYRNAVYGTDARGFATMNLVRHKREYPHAGESRDAGGESYIAGLTSDASRLLGALGSATTLEVNQDDDFGLRLARTPVPQFVAEAVETHLSRIYAREVGRDGPVGLKAWWLDVDGRGTTIDDWMADTVAPLLAVLGQIDLLFDHPKAPAGEEVATQSQVKQFGLDRCVASYILPENLVWWALRPDGSYAECLVREGGGLRHWTAAGSRLIAANGDATEDRPHGFGRVPIVRVFDRRKTRCDNVGQSRYEGIAELQREYYNRDSELILSDSTQAHPLLQGPEDYVQADGTIPIGPSWLLPKKKVTSGAQTYYEKFDYVDPPKGAAESIRQNKGDLRDDADRAAHLTKPAGTAGTSGATVGQSGISKRLDQTTANDVLGKLSAVLARAEVAAARMALRVLSDGDPSPADVSAIVVSYPRQFDLSTPSELAANIGDFQDRIRLAGRSPTVEKAMLSHLARLALPGLDDRDYAAFDAEIAGTIDANAASLPSRAETPAADRAAGEPDDPPETVQ